MVKSKKYFLIFSLLLICCLSLFVSGLFGGLSFFDARAQVREGKVQSEDVVVMDSFDDYTSVCAYGAPQNERVTTIAAINGATSMGGGVSSFPSMFSRFWDPIVYDDGHSEDIKTLLSGTEDGKVLKSSLNPWGFSIFNDVTFNTPVQLNSEVNAIIFRLYLHLSSSDTYCLESGAVRHGNLGIWIYGIGDTGVAGEGVMIPFNVTQDEWINFEIVGDDAYKLADENGVIRGFIVAAGVIDNDKSEVLYKTSNSLWIDRVSKGFRVSKPNRTIMGGNGDWTQTASKNSVATSIEGVTAMGGGVTNFGFSDFSWVSSTPQDSVFAGIKGSAEDMNIVGHVFNGWGFTVSRVMSFTAPVARADVDAITFRIAAHLSSGDTYGIVGTAPPNGGTGIYFFAPDSDGAQGTGVLLPYDIKQDEWVDFMVSGEDLDKLTDANGMISGFYIGSGIIAENSAVLYPFVGNSLSKAAYLLIDSVKFNNKKTLSYKDGETVLKSAEIYTGENPFYVPEKDGKAFIGWRVNSVDGRLLEAREEFSDDILSLYAEWTDAGDIVANKGLYTDTSGKTVMIFNDGDVKFDDGFGKVFYHVYGANGILYVFTAEERLEINFESLNKTDSAEISYMDGEFGDITFFKTLIAKNSSAPNVSNANSSFEFWSKTLGGREYDFSEIISEDTVLYAVNRYTKADRMIVTGNDDFKEGENWLLQSIGGVTSMNDGTVTFDNRTYKFFFRIKNVNVSTQERWAGSDDGKAFSMLIGPWGFSVGKPILFNTPVKVEKYDSITFRIFAHLSPTSPYGGELWGGTGVRIFGAHSDGSDSGVLIPLNIEQDKWVDLTVGKDLLNVLADDDGYMYGFTIGAAIVVDTSKETGSGRWYTEFDWEAQSLLKSTYVLVDYITVSSEKTMSFIDDNGEVLESQSFMGGTTVEKSFVPKKSGYVFTGWSAYGKPLDYSEKFFQDVNLYANWVASADPTAAAGLYTDVENTISIFKDGSVAISGVRDVISYGLGADGVLYAACTDGVKTFRLADYVKNVAYEVTVDDGMGGSEKYLVKNGDTLYFDVERNGYLVDKIVKTGSSEIFVVGVDSITADTALTVIWRYDEIEDYSDVYGRYYCSGNNATLELRENNVAVYNGTEYAYYVLSSDEIVIEGLKNGTYVGTYIDLDGSFVRLGKVTVSFDTGRGNPPIDSQTLSESENYKATKPADPQAEGLEFVCWMTADGNEFDFDTMLTGSIHLFAKWNKVAKENTEEILPEPTGKSAGCSGNITSELSVTVLVLCLCVIVTFIGRRNRGRKVR